MWTARGLSARRWSSVALLLTGALTIAAATLGPLYARAAQESVLHDRLSSQPAEQTGLHVAYQSVLSDTARLQAAVSQAPKPGFIDAYPSQILGAQVLLSFQSSAGAPTVQKAYLAWRDGACRQLVFTTGRCPSAAGEAIVSARAVSGPYGYRLGSKIMVNGVTLTVVGIYRPVDPEAGYWFGRNYFNAALPPRGRPVAAIDGPDTIDAVFVDRSTLATLGGSAGADPIKGELDIDYPLDVDAVRLNDLSAVRAAVADLRPFSGAKFTDPLPSVLSSDSAERHQVETGSLLVSLQLAALALLVLFAASGDALDSRGNDVALAKLRGLTPLATLRFLLAETLLLLVLAVPVGLGIGILATHVLAGLLLTGGVPVVAPWAALVAAFAAFAGAVLAALLAARRVLTRPVLEQWRGAARNAGRSRQTLITDTVVAAAAVVGLVLLKRGRSGNIALLAPGLLVLAVSLLGVRLVPLLVRRAIPVTRGSSRLGRYLALRLVGRRPAAMRLAVLLAVAVGLAVFGVAGESAATTNRTDRAQVEVGAPRSVAVQFNPQDDPIALSHAADPAGKWAMITAKWLPGGGGSVVGTMLGVDSSRLVAVGYPTTQGASLVKIAATVGPPLPAPIQLTAASVRFSLTTSDLKGVAPRVQILVQPNRGESKAIVAGNLRTGTHEYHATVPCSAGCRLIGFAWDRPSGTFDPISGTVTLTALRGSTGSSGAGSTPINLGLTEPASWKGQSPDGTDAATTSRVQVSAAGIRDAFTSTSGSSAGIARLDRPAVLPTWAGAGAVSAPPPRGDGTLSPLTLTDANAKAYRFEVAGTSRAVPGAAATGLIADVSFLSTQLPSFAREANWSVWLGPNAPPDALARLAAAGLQPGKVTSTSARITALGHQGPALALALLLACAIAAAVLAMGAMATAIAASGQRRAFELAALRVLGVSRGALTRATILEQVALLGSAMLLGVPSGVVAALVAMPVIPQFSDSSPLHLADTIKALPIVVVVAVFVLVLLVTAVAAGTSLVRNAVPSRLRESAS
jgi:putative ABC transport system permease protein